MSPTDTREPSDASVSDAAAFARGLALFASGQPFEAHEEWEQCWKAAKARGDDVDERFLRGVIHVCAAQIKATKRVEAGRVSHLESAVRLLTTQPMPAKQRGIDVVSIVDQARAALESIDPARTTAITIVAAPTT